MLTGVYVRVSTEEQAKEGYSIRAQIEKLSNYALAKDWILYDVYKDEGISGKDIEGRPEMKRLLNDIKQGKVQNVLVFKIDRLTRSTRDLIDLVEFFNSQHCAFNSLNEAIDTTTATGRMFIKIIGIFAEFERENTIERVKVGNARKAKEGYTLSCAVSSYGYDRQNGSKDLEINIEEAKIVREVYDLYVYQNMSITGIGHLLNQRGIPTKKNKRWSTKTINLMLRNSTYIGKIRYQVKSKSDYTEFEGVHEAIISEDLFYKANQKLDNMERVTRTKHPKSDAYFTGIAICERCGTKLSPKRAYKRKDDGIISYSGYRCVASTRGLCDSSTISHLKLEDAFLNYLGILGNLDDVKESDLQLEDDSITAIDFTIEIKGIEKEIDNLGIRSKEIIEQYVNNRIDFEEYRAMADAVKTALVELNNRLQQMKNQNRMQPSTPKIDYKKIVRDIRKNWMHLTNDEKLLFVQKFFEQIVVDTEQIENQHRNKVLIKKIEFRGESTDRNF